MSGGVNKMVVKNTKKKKLIEKKKARCTIAGINIKEKKIRLDFHDIVTWNGKEMIVFENSAPESLENHKDLWFKISQDISLIYQLYKNKELLWLKFDEKEVFFVETTNV